MKIKLAAAVLMMLGQMPADAAQPSGLTLATRNIQTLATPGRKVFSDSATGEQRDYEDGAKGRQGLRRYHWHSLHHEFFVSALVLGYRR